MEYNINNLLETKKPITDRVNNFLDLELIKQKKEGKKFISDEEIDELVSRIIKEELENPTTEPLIKCYIDVNVLLEVIKQWWNTWHKFAKEEDEPPQYIKEIITILSTNLYHFDLMSGKFIKN